MTQRVPVQWANQPEWNRQAANAINLLIPEEGVWVPIVTPGSGSFTTVSATGSYIKIGRQVFTTAKITITANGTAGLSVFYTLPFTSAVDAIGCGRESAVTGTMLQVVIQSGSGSANILTYNNAYPGASGYVLTVTATYYV